MTFPNSNTTGDYSGWTCSQCGRRVPNGCTHSCPTGVSLSNLCPKCGKPVYYIGDNFDPSMVCQCGKVNLQSPSLDFGEKQIFERIAVALERIADRLDEIHK